MINLTLEAQINIDDLIESLKSYSSQEIIDFILEIEKEKGDWSFSAKLLEELTEKVFLPGIIDFVIDSKNQSDEFLRIKNTIGELAEGYGI